MMIRKIAITLLLISTVCAAFGQKSRSGAGQKPRTRVEWGVLGGVNFPQFTTDMAQVKNKLGWQAGLFTAVNFGIFALEPQILYVRQGLRVRSEGSAEVNLKSNSIDVPVLVSFRMLRPLRIFAGPVFTVMNDCKQKTGGDLLDFGRVRPTLSFTAGVGVLLARHLLVDLRYNGQFRSKREVVLPDGGQLDRLRNYNFALSIGYQF